MRISDFIAQSITHRRALVWSGVTMLTAVCIAILVTSLRLDSEVFNVLPGRFPSVQGLKIYDHDFEQTRQLTFALVCQPNDVDKLDDFAPVFAERLRQQPWCERVLSGSPMATTEGIRDLQSMAVPSRSSSPLAAADRGWLAAATVRAFIRPARFDCAGAKTFC